MSYKLAIVNEQGQVWIVEENISEYNLDDRRARAEIAIAIQLRMKEADLEQGR